MMCLVIFPWVCSEGGICYRISFLYDSWKILWLFFRRIVWVALCRLFAFIWILQRRFRFVLMRFSCLLLVRHVSYRRTLYRSFYVGHHWFCIFSAEASPRAIAFGLLQPRPCFCITGRSTRCFRWRFEDRLQGCFCLFPQFLLYWIVVIPLAHVRLRVLSFSGSLVCMI